MIEMCGSKTPNLIMFHYPSKNLPVSMVVQESQAQMLSGALQVVYESEGV